MSYSYDLRKRVVVYVLDGGQITRAATLFGVHRQTIHAWMRMERTDSLRAASKPGPKEGRKVTRARLQEALAQHPDAKLTELGRLFDVHPATICHACQKWQITRKKNVGIHRAK
jgi:putative transposase